MTHLGVALEKTLNDYGIRGPIVGVEADAFTITVYRPVQTSDGKSVALFEDPETGERDTFCVVEETFDLRVKEPL